MSKRVEILLRHYNHKAKREIIDYLIDNEDGDKEAMAVARYMTSKLKGSDYMKPGNQSQTNQFLSQLYKDGIIKKHPRTGIRVYYYTNPEFLKFIETIHGLEKDFTICDPNRHRRPATAHTEVQYE